MVVNTDATPRPQREALEALLRIILGALLPRRLEVRGAPRQNTAIRRPQAATPSSARRSSQALLYSIGLRTIYGSDDPAVYCLLVFCLDLYNVFRLHRGDALLNKGVMSGA